MNAMNLHRRTLTQPQYDIPIASRTVLRLSRHGLLYRIERNFPLGFRPSLTLGN